MLHQADILTDTAVARTHYSIITLPHLVFFFLLLIAFFLASANPFGQSKSVTLCVTDWADVDEIPLVERTLAEFKKQYPNIDILYDPIPVRQYEQKILTALATDEPPDVFLLDSKLIPTFTKKRVLLDFAPYIASLRIELKSLDALLPVHKTQCNSVSSLCSLCNVSVLDAFERTLLWQNQESDA